MQRKADILERVSAGAEGTANISTLDLATRCSCCVTCGIGAQVCGVGIHMVAGINWVNS